MKVLVAVKRVEDPESRISVLADGSGISAEGVNHRINPFDAVALEEALRLVACHGGEVVVVSMGPACVHSELRHALALGAHRAIWISHDGPLDAPLVSRLLQAVIEREGPDLVLLGKQGTDSDQGVVGALLAERLDWGFVSRASRRGGSEATPGLDVDVVSGKISAVREVDGGLERVEADLPAVVTAELRLCEPRYAKLAGIRRARSAELEALTPEALGVEMTLSVVRHSLAPPPERPKGVRVADVAELVARLRGEARVL